MEENLIEKVIETSISNNDTIKKEVDNIVNILHSKYDKAILDFDFECEYYDNPLYVGEEPYVFEVGVEVFDDLICLIEDMYDFDFYDYVHQEGEGDRYYKGEIVPNTCEADTAWYIACQINNDRLLNNGFEFEEYIRFYPISD